MRLAIMVLAPVILLGGLELVLRMTGYGYPTAFFLNARQGRERMLIENERFGWRFVPPKLARTPQPLRIPARKADSTLRIFVFGESAAMGDPEPAYGFPRLLKVLLEGRYPGQRFEMVNTAMTAINSHEILPIARECAGRQGDVWVVYMGNNEVVGPFGAGTVFSAKAPPLSWLRASLALKTTRLGQLLTAVLERLARPKAEPQFWAGMEMFLQQHVRADEPGLARVYDYFRRNLEAILASGARHGAKIVVSTVVSNLRDCAPFGSEHRRDLGAAPLDQWTKDYRQGCQLQEQGKWSEALAAFQQAAALDPTYAQLQFRLGRVYWALTNYTESLRAYQAALELDTLRFRADIRINQLIRQAATNRVEEGIYLMDAAAQFAAASPHGIVGEEYLYEHVHLNFGGNYLLARLVADQIARVLPALDSPVSTAGWLSGEECAKRLALTDWNRYRIVENMLQRFRHAPFAEQLDRAERDRRWERWRTELEPATRREALPRWSAVYRIALEHVPDDWVIHNQFGKLLEAFGDLKGAEQEWRAVLELVPQHTVVLYQLGRLLNRGPDRSLAINCLREALRRLPYFPEALNSLGIALAHQDKISEAGQYFAQALAIRPDYAEAQADWGATLAFQGKNSEARAHFQAALKLNDDNAVAHLGLARLLAQQGDEPGALAHFQQSFALQSEPAATHLEQALAAMGQGKKLEALAQFNEAVRLDPGLAAAQHGLGITLARLDRLDEAISHFAAAARLQTNSPTYHLDLGVALARRTRFEEAIGQFRTVLQLQPTNKVAQQYIDTAQGWLNRRPAQTQP